jgi:hypothetical protein
VNDGPRLIPLLLLFLLLFLNVSLCQYTKPYILLFLGDFLCLTLCSSPSPCSLVSDPALRLTSLYLLHQGLNLHLFDNCPS